MRFGSIQWLWALLLIPILLGYLVWTIRQRARLASRFAEPGLWKKLAGEVSAKYMRWKPVLFIAAVALIIVALAGPQWGARAVMLQRRGLDIVVALDVSRSMLAADVKPNRLQRAKREISAVLDRLKGDRIGLVVFSGDAFVQCPLTLDASAARMLLDATGINSGGRPGTAVSEAIEEATGMYEEGEKQFKVMILVTDGEGTEGDALAAAQDAATQGIRIYTVGVGTPQGEPIPDFDERGNQIGFKKDESGQIVLSKLDEVTLQKVALATNGRYFRAGPSQMELDALFDELSTLEKKEMEGRLFTEFEQRFHYFLLPAFLLLALEMALPSRGKKSVLVLLALSILFASPAQADQFAKRNNTGNKLLEDGRIDSAITEYQAARVERPSEPGVVYNLGSAYHQKGAFDTAATQLQNSLAHVDEALKPSAYYNLGNTLYRMQEYEAAIESYKQALIANPTDLEAKHNLELTLRKMNQSQDSTSQKQEQDQKQENQQDSTGQQDQNQQQQQDQDSTQNQQQQQQQNQDGNQDQQQQEQDQQQDGQPREQRQPQQVQGMTKADAERLLDALKQNELALQKKRAQRVSGEKVAKDW